MKFLVSLVDREIYKKNNYEMYSVEHGSASLGLMYYENIDITKQLEFYQYLNKNKLPLVLRDETDFESEDFNETLYYVSEITPIVTMLSFDEFHDCDYDDDNITIQVMLDEVY